MFWTPAWNEISVIMDVFLGGDQWLGRKMCAYWFDDPFQFIV